MNIRIDQGQNRRIAWTDRKNGYLELVTCTADSCPGGYYRGETRYLSDFFLAMPSPDSAVADMYRTNARFTEVRRIYVQEPVRVPFLFGILEFEHS